MIDLLRPYGEMRPTGVPWLGEVPSHWTVRRIKTLLREIDNRSKTGEERLLSLRMRQGLVDHINAGGKPIPPESLVNFKIIEPGQVVMNRMRAAAGLFGVADVRGLVSPDYAVFEPKPEAYNPYLLQAFRLPSLSAVFRAESKGLGTGESGFLRLYTDRFGPIPVPYPPIDEQRLIVRFLDWHGAQTAKLIRAKKKIIALLNEQKQAIIHRAVTRGLDPNAKLKPSGIPWLGDVPEGWEIVRLRYLATKFGSGITPRGGAAIYQPSGVPFLRSQNIHFDGLRLDDVAFISYELHQHLGGTHVQPHDVLLNITGASLGRVCAVPKKFDEGNVNQHVCIIRPKPNRITSDYLASYLSTGFMQREIRFEQNGASREGLTLAAIKSMHILVPPLDQQRNMSFRVADEASEVNAAINIASNEIALIQEFHTRLVADVVTGKLDIRNSAEKLPEFIEIEPIDDLIELDDFEESATDLENEEVAA